MNAQELDDVYTQLCHGLTAAGEEATPSILARLVLLLLLQAPSAQGAAQAVSDALAGLTPGTASAGDPPPPCSG